MFIVRLTFADRGPDFKAFESLTAAKRRFAAAGSRMPEDITSAVVFQVEATNPKDAIEAVKGGHATIIQRDHWAEIQRGADEIVAEWVKGQPDV